MEVDVTVSWQYSNAGSSVSCHARQGSVQYLRICLST